jgi:PST family polysaccharide transporter
MAILKRLINHTIAKNAIALYGVQFSGYLLPLITIPYLARILGPEEFGSVAFAQSFALWLSIVAEYGFNLSAAREVACCQQEKKKLSEIVTTVQGAKLILIIFLFLSILPFFWLIPIFKQKPDYFVWAFLYILALGFSPFWYFQGTENMVKAVMLEFILRVLSTATIFAVVNVPDDGWKVLALQAFAGLLSTGIPIFWIYRETSWRWFDFNKSLLALRQGWSMFLFRTASSLYMTAGILILGFLSSPVYVGYYAGADKLYRATTSLFGPLTLAIYPRISFLVHSDIDQALRWIRLTLISTFWVAVALGLTVSLVSPLIVKFILGKGYEATVPALRILACTIPINAVNTVLGMQWLLPHGMEKVSGKIMLSVGVVNILLNLIFVPKIFHLGAAWALMISEIIIFISSYYVLRINRISPFSFSKTL